MAPAQDKFIIIPDLLTVTDKMVILTDIVFWSSHEDQLRQWCADNDSDFIGMTVVFPNEKTLAMFVLKWS